MLQRFDTVLHLPVLGQGVSLGGKSKRLIEAFNPSQGWLFHFEKISDDDASKRSEPEHLPDRYNLYLTDLNGGHSVLLGQLKETSSTSTPRWWRDGSVSYRASESSFYEENVGCLVNDWHFENDYRKTHDPDTIFNLAGETNECIPNDEIMACRRYSRYPFFGKFCTQ